MQSLTYTQHGLREDPWIAFVIGARSSAGGCCSRAGGKRWEDGNLVDQIVVGLI
jgi:hypothetical protein